ncbi:hypothetical protein AB0E04_23765 [Streptomyces sp. NPDC048251]|uniref:hypothetical protein n=1 Tax=Streptomyces sp. NPDC048251 TaxID=3154501 RepID=UPI00343B86F3
MNKAPGSTAATTVLEIGGFRLLTDPVFDLAPAQYRFGTVILHFEAAQVDEIGEPAITLDGAQGAELTRSLGAKDVVPVHYASWAHFSRVCEDIVTAFEQADLTDRLRWLTPGIPTLLV